MKPQVLTCSLLTAYLSFLHKEYDKKEFAVCQEAVTRTSRAMKKLGEINIYIKKSTVVVLKVFCLLFLICKSLFWPSSSEVRNSLLSRFGKIAISSASVA